MRTLLTNSNKREDMYMSDEQYAQELREELLLKVFRELTPTGQKKVIDYADDIKEKYVKEPEEIVVE